MLESDSEFAPMEYEDELRLNTLHDANHVSFDESISQIDLWSLIF